MLYPQVVQSGTDVDVPDGCIAVKNINDYIKFIKSIKATRVCKYCGIDAKAGFVWDDAHYAICSDTTQYYSMLEKYWPLTKPQLIRKIAKLQFAKKEDDLDVLLTDKQQLLVGLDLLLPEYPEFHANDLTHTQRQCIRLVTRELQMYRANKK